MKKVFLLRAAVLLPVVLGLSACSSSESGSESVDVVTETVAAQAAPVETAPPVTENGLDLPAETVAETPALPVAGEFGSGPCAAADGSATQQREFDAAPQKCIDEAKTYTATMTTNRGVMVFELLAKKAPVTVNNFVNLARSKYYDGIFFHRIVPQFVLQAGDPGALGADQVARAGAGGPGYSFGDELPQQGEYSVGSLAMANAGPNTNGSQFFIISGPNGTSLPPLYAYFGQMTDAPENLVTLNAIAALGVGDGPPSEPVSIESVTISES